jgi:RimK family alpha-L-glutamate ligase
MKITLITTLPNLSENISLEKEVALRGWEFETIDLSGFGYFIDEGILDIRGLNSLKSDLVIVRGIFQSINTISSVVASLRKRGIKVFDNNLAGLNYSIDKVADLAKLSLAGIEVPKSAYSRDFDEFPALAKKIGYPVIVKFTRTGKGARIYKLNSEAQLSKLIANLIKEERKAKYYLLQEFIPYLHDLRVLIIGEKQFCMKRIPEDGEFRANFSLGGRVELFNLDQKGNALAQKALDACELSIGGVDMLIGQDGRRYIIEVNHTAGWLGMEKATGENITALWLNHALREAK